MEPRNSNCHYKSIFRSLQKMKAVSFVEKNWYACQIWKCHILVLLIAGPPRLTSSAVCFFVFVFFHLKNLIKLSYCISLFRLKQESSDFWWYYRFYIICLFGADSWPLLFSSERQEIWICALEEHLYFMPANILFKLRFLWW